MMLAGKAPIDPTALTTSTVGGKTVIQERIVYRDGQNKENNTELEEELKNKENELRNEQEEKRLLAEKLEGLQKVFEHGAGPANEDKSELQRIKKLKQKLKVQKKKE